MPFEDDISVTFKNGGGQGSRVGSGEGGKRVSKWNEWSFGHVVYSIEVKRNDRAVFLCDSI